MRLTPILATLLVAFPAVAFAAAEPEGVFEGLKPKLVVVDVFEANPKFVFDNKSQSGGQGARVGFLYGITLTKTVSRDVSIGLNYDHAVLTSYVQGDPQPWNESGRYLYGRRDYNMYGVSVNVRLK